MQAQRSGSGIAERIPEGVNPAPATIKTTVFDENGGFSNFLSIFLRRHAVGKTNLATPTRRHLVDGDEIDNKNHPAPSREFRLCGMPAELVLNACKY